MRTDSGYLLEYNSILEEAPLSQIYIICEHHITMARELEDKLSFIQPHVLKDIEAVIDQLRLFQHGFDSTKTLIRRFTSWSQFRCTQLHDSNSPYVSKLTYTKVFDALLTRKFVVI